MKKFFSTIGGNIRDVHIGALLAISYLLFNVVFWAYPFIWLAILSFTDWRFFDTPVFSGLKNIYIILDDVEFWRSLWNVARFLGYYIPMAMFSISLMVTWKFVGYYGLILYSGLVDIPKEIYDAARLDNATPLTRLLRVTLPMINGQLIMVLIFAITVAFGIFTEPYMMTGGGPLESTNMPLLVMYETAFSRLQPGRAALMAIIIALVSYAVIKIMRRAFERNVELV